MESNIELSPLTQTANIKIDSKFNRWTSMTDNALKLVKRYET